ncbi:rhodanese-like domain-containing protein [Shimia sp.]|uniref:rhodanese-like domain-containing protein n=1 Tax=Shimia sp. TaxID=1954381 RepID=UPI003299370A
MNRRMILGAIAAFSMSSGIVLAGDGLMSAPEAKQNMDAGRLILIDIRTPQEWADTGVAEGAWPMDMRHRQFGAKLMSVLERYPDRDIAVICRSGNRSGYIVDVLASNNIQRVLDVTEGMAGGRNGKGWIPTGLPVVSAHEALAAMPSEFRTD